MDLVDGRPTGSVRVSFGYMSTFDDAKKFVSFVEQNFQDCSDNVDVVCDGVDDVMDKTSDVIGRNGSDVMGDIVKRKTAETAGTGEGEREGERRGEGERRENGEKEKGGEEMAGEERRGGGGGRRRLRVGDPVTVTTSDNASKRGNVGSDVAARDITIFNFNSSLHFHSSLQAVNIPTLWTVFHCSPSRAVEQ